MYVSISQISKYEQNYMIMKKKKEWQPKKKFQTTKLSKEATLQLGEKQYAQAMKHMKRLNNYEAEKKVHVEPLDPQCTFKPRLCTDSYKGFTKSALNVTKRQEKKPQNRLIEWGHQRQRKQIQRVLNFSVEIENNVQKNLRASIEKSKTKSYLHKHFLTSNNLTMRDPSPKTKNYPTNHGLKFKQNSETTLFTNKKSRSELFT